MTHSPTDENRERLAEQYRTRMVERQLRTRDITDERVLAAMQRVPRHRFVPAVALDTAYADHPAPIGLNQTISQPYIVALMTQLADVGSESRVLDVGTGSGYQAAVLAELCQHVECVEIHAELAERAAELLHDLGYKNVTVHTADGWNGWPPNAPYDAIICAAAPASVPPALVEQLSPHGRLVLPVGIGSQELMVLQKMADGSTHVRHVAFVSFVPMTGLAGPDSGDDSE